MTALLRTLIGLVPAILITSPLFGISILDLGAPLFLYFLVYRFIGGIPFFIANTMPVIFNVKIKNYFLGTLIGMVPQLFIMVSIGSGLEKIIEANSSPPSFLEIVLSKDIYLPLLAFLIIVVISIFLKKNYINKIFGAPCPTCTDDFFLTMEILYYLS